MTAEDKAVCNDCGLEYGGDSWIEAIIPDNIWNIIKPDGCADGCGILCISCIARRLREREIKIKIPIWLCGTEPLTAMEGDPMKNLKILRDFNIKQK
jgi:hypothetical protein